MLFRDISKRSLGHLKTTWLLGQSINWKKDTAAAAASTATASVPIPNEAAQSTQTLTPHLIDSQLVNNPQVCDALEYAPPLKKNDRIVFCACIYHTRKETNPFNLHHPQTNIKKYSVARKKDAVLSFL